MNMNCFNPHYPDGMDFRRQDPMPDMSSWYMDQGYPPCGMPPTMIQPRSESNSRQSGRTPWMPADTSMPSGSGSVRDGMGRMGSMPGETAPMNMGTAPANMGTAPANMGAAPANLETAPANMGAMPAMPGNMAQGQNNMAFCEDLDRFPIGMGYVPMQRWSQPSPLDEGFCRGTIFTELDLPFVMGRCM